MTTPSGGVVFSIDLANAEVIETLKLLLEQYRGFNRKSQLYRAPEAQNCHPYYVLRVLIEELLGSGSVDTRKAALALPPGVDALSFDQACRTIEDTIGVTTV